MERIASFNVDHTILNPGLYLSRVDGSITTFDMRFKKPNTGDLLSNAQMHSVEHIMATFLRNSIHKDAVIYFGPMGCQTGFYFLFDHTKLSHAQAIALLQETVHAGANYDGAMPGQSAIECGNYINLDGALSKACLREYFQIIKDWNESKLSYPQSC